MGRRANVGLPSWARRGPGLAVGLLLVGLWLTALPEITTHVRGPIVGLVALGVVLPLFWRRRAPMLTFALAVTAAAFQWVLVGPLFVDLAVLIGFYTIVSTSSRIRTLVAAGILMFGVVLACAYYGRGGDYAVVALFLTGLVVAAGVLGLNVKVRAAYLAEVEGRAARLEVERDQQGRLAVAAERTRIAREMHDIVAHNLSVMIALNDGASFAMTRDPDQAAEAVREASSVGRTALREMQRVLGVLRDVPEAAGSATDEVDRLALAPAPTIADLDALLLPIRRTGLAVTLTEEGPLRELSPGLQLTIYRLVQESLTNTVKHAVGADLANILIRRDGYWITVEVVDNGSTRPSAGEVGGHGLIGMRERAAGHGGQVEAGPTAVGWAVRASYPLVSEEASQSTLLRAGANP